MSSSLTTEQKVALGVGAAAAGALFAGLIYSRYSRNKAISLDESGPSKGKGVKETEVVLAKVAALKEQGNNAFKQGRLEDAIKFYSEALSLSSSEKHALYSNRAACLISLEKYDEAIADAKKAIETKPDWSKGYFRLGKAYFHKHDMNQAYLNFYRGLLLEPKSEELRKYLEQAKAELGPGELDSRANVEAKVLRLYFLDTAESLAQGLKIPYAVLEKELEADIAEATDAKAVVKRLLSDSSVESIAQHGLPDSPTRLKLIYAACYFCLANDKGDHAYELALSALSTKPGDPTALVLLANSELKKKEPLPIEALQHLRQSVLLDSSNVLACHMYASILVRVSNIIGTPDFPVTIFQVLKELLVCLNSPNVTKLIIAEAGLMLWLRLLQDPQIQHLLYKEEEDNVAHQRSPNEAYLRGLTQGVFAQLFLEPFFVQCLSETPFTNPGLERLLLPLRSSLASISPSSSDLQTLLPLIFAIGMQSHRTGYVLIYMSPEEESTVEKLQKVVEHKLKSADPSAVGGSVDASLTVQLGQLVMYMPLTSIPNIEPFCEKVDLSILHPTLASLLRLVLDAIEERKIKETLEAITELPETPVRAFYNSHVVPAWDTVPNALSRVTIKQELDWLFPSYDFSSFGGRCNVLVAGVGSGMEAAQMSTVYKDVDVTAIDFSETQVAYAVRQSKALQLKDVDFYLADINILRPKDFQGIQFDVIVANNILHHLPDPFVGWQNLSRLLRKGGVMRVGVYPRRFIDVIAGVRRFLTLSGAYSSPIFDTPKDATALPRLLRPATETDIRTARNVLLAACENANQSTPSFLFDIVGSPAFFSLHDFADVVFNPQILGFSFSSLGECMQRLQLKLIGFEFPGISQETILNYRAEYPDDPNLISFAHLDEFDAKYPEAFRSFSNSLLFTCQKV